jgi:hypothetical protein
MWNRIHLLPIVFGFEHGCGIVQNVASAMECDKCAVDNGRPEAAAHHSRGLRIRGSSRLHNQWSAKNMR